MKIHRPFLVSGYCRLTHCTVKLALALAVLPLAAAVSLAWLPGWIFLLVEPQLVHRLAVAAGGGGLTGHRAVSLGYLKLWLADAE